MKNNSLRESDLKVFDYETLALKKTRNTSPLLQSDIITTI